MLDSYLDILKRSLEGKIKVLQRIADINRIQTEALQKEALDMEAFDKAVDDKDECIRELTKLDEGFETLYDRIKTELAGNKAAYATQIKRLQDLIAQITDMSVAVQAQEARNKTLLESYFAKEKANIGKVRKSTKAAYGYYQSMSRNVGMPGSGYMDKKQ